jgi:hypothetical protein
MTNRGILQVSYVLRNRSMACLPPEHRVLAIKPGQDVEEWLVEGPMMPPCSDGFEPERVAWAFRVHWLAGGTLTLTAEFRLRHWNDRLLGEWTIGTWPSSAAYQTWLIDQG